MVIFIYNQKNLCADDYAATVCAIKATQLKQDRTTLCVFFNARTVSVAIWQTIYLVPLAKRRSEQENVFTTNNTRPNQKINRLNQSALILT